MYGCRGSHLVGFQYRPCRWQAGFLDSPLDVIARTDAEVANLLDSIFDPIDHPHILGAAVQGVETLSEATQQGKDDRWKTHGLHDLT